MAVPHSADTGPLRRLLAKLADGVRPALLLAANAFAALLIFPFVWQAAVLATVAATASLAVGLRLFSDAPHTRTSAVLRGVSATALAITAVGAAALGVFVFGDGPIYVVASPGATLGFQVDQQQPLDPQQPAAGRVLFVRNSARLFVATQLQRRFPNAIRDITVRQSRSAENEHLLRLPVRWTVARDFPGLSAADHTQESYLGFSGLSGLTSIETPVPLGARIPLPKDVFRFGLALSHCALISVTQRLADEAPRWQDVTVRGAVDLGAAAYAATLAQALDTLARRAPSDGVSLLNRASELAPHALERTRTLVLMANAARCLAQGNIGNRQALAVYQRVYGELLPAIEREQENASTRVSPLSRTVLERWLYETLMTVYATDQEDFAIFSDRAHVLRAWYEHQRTGLRFLSRAEIIRDAGLPPTATDDDLARAIAREIRAGDNVFEQYAAELAATSDAAFIEEVEASRANPARLRSLLEALVVRSAIDLTPDSTRVEVPRLLAQIDRNIARLGHLAAAMASFEADERPHATVIVEAAQQFLTFYRRLYAGAIGGTPPTAQDVVRTFEAIGGAHFPCTMSFVRTLDFDNLSLIPLTPPADCLDARQASWWDPSFVDGHVRLVAALAIKFLVKTDARGASLNGTDLAEIGPREFQFLEDRARRLFVPSLLAINRFFEPAGDPQERQWLASVLGTDSYDQAVDARGWNAETRLTLQLTLPQ